MTGSDTITLGAVELTPVFEQRILLIPRDFAFPDIALFERTGLADPGLLGPGH